MVVLLLPMAGLAVKVGANVATAACCAEAAVAAVAAPAIVSAVPVQAGAAVAASTPDALTCPAHANTTTAPSVQARSTMHHARGVIGQQAHVSRLHNY
jgi:hypothetical protein